MSESPRDTQFLGIAELLYSDLRERWMEDWKWQDGMKLYIAQRVHDIVKHATGYTLEYLHECGREIPTDMDKRILPSIPDMTSWGSHGYQETSNEQKKTDVQAHIAHNSRGNGLQSVRDCSHSSAPKAL